MPFLPPSRLRITLHFNSSRVLLCGIVMDLDSSDLGGIRDLVVPVGSGGIVFVCFSIVILPLLNLI